MRISHKWSHTETILQAQSQSHNLTSSHKISGSYPPGSGCPSHIFILFPCDHHWNYPPGSVPDFTISEGLTPVSASLSHIYLTNIHSIHSIFDFTFQNSFSLYNICTSHFNHHFILNSYQITHSLIFYIYSKELTYILVY